jgi:hypothetical protein
MPSEQHNHRRLAASWIGAVLLICGLMLLAMEWYLHYTDGVVQVGKASYFRVQRSSPVLMLTIAIVPAVLGAGLLIWTRATRSSFASKQ